MRFQEEKGLRKNQLKTKNQNLICIVLVQSKVSMDMLQTFHRMGPVVSIV